MTARPRTWCRVAAAVFVTAGTGCMVSAGPAVAAGGCDGVLVVVEGRSLGGGAARCASNPSDGLSALRQAGFGVTLGTGRYSGGFVCAIDARPARGCDEVDADTYWSYWSMQPGTDRWVYGSVGAAASRPTAGGIDAWVWQDGGAAEPPAARSAGAPSPAPSPATTPVAPPPAAGSPGRPASTAPGSAGAAAGEPAPAPAPAAATGGAPAGTEAAAPVTSAGPSSQAVQSPEPSFAPAAALTGNAEAGSGPPGWTGAAGLLVAALIGADAFRRARTRRKDAG